MYPLTHFHLDWKLVNLYVTLQNPPSHPDPTTNKMLKFSAVCSLYFVLVCYELSCVYLIVLIILKWIVITEWRGLQE